MPRDPIRLPPVYPVTDRLLAGGLDHPAIARAAALGGATLLQVREKELPDAVLLEQLRKCLRLPGLRVIVNDRPDLARVAGAAGVHLGDEDLPPVEARRILGPDAIIGLSTHSPEEAVEAGRREVDYVALGPIFATSTKEAPRPPLGVEAVARAAPRMKRPLVAIGGITLETAPALWRAGAASVAVISAVMAPGEITGRVRAWMEAAER